VRECIISDPIVPAPELECDLDPASTNATAIQLSNLSTILKSSNILITSASRINGSYRSFKIENAINNLVQISSNLRDSLASTLTISRFQSMEVALKSAVIFMDHFSLADKIEMLASFAVDIGKFCDFFSVCWTQLHLM